MENIKFDVDKQKKHGIIKGSYVDQIREAFSVSNDAAKFARYRNRFTPSRKYIITPAGKFDPGMFLEIKKYITNNQLPVRITMSEAFKELVFPSYSDKSVADLKLELRDYQKEIVSVCLRVGRGVTVLATAGGKTLTMASLLESVYRSNKMFKCLLLVPNLSLVSQTHTDFIEYGVSFSHSKWTGNDNLNIGTNVIVANTSILQSSKSDTSWIEHIDILVVDEVHGLRKNNKINKVLKTIRTPNRFGFTGTMPEEHIDQWNIIGKIGPVLYEKNSYQLRKDDYIAHAVVQILRLKYKQEPPRGKKSDPLDRYQKEMDFLIESDFRNNIIAKLSNNTDNNCLILLDYIRHGEAIYDTLKDKCKDKQIFFIRGDVEVEQRETIRALMEESNNVICIAISKIFSTGINIKNLHYIMFAGSGKAKIKTLQSIGRGLRKHHTKSELVIFDIADLLYYGRQHMDKRVSFYEKERLKSGTMTIEE
jgi:superfamily II DNA or RNA helicase